MIRLVLIALLSISSLFADHFRDATIAYRGGNFTLAKEQFELSIKKESCWQSYFYLGKMYLYGEGIESNPSQAIPYLEQAVMRGNVKAKCYLAEAYIKTQTKQEEVTLLLNQGARESSVCREIASSYNISLNG